MAPEEEAAPVEKTAEVEPELPVVTPNDLFNAVRFGSVEKVRSLLTRNKEIVDAFDLNGYNAAHWAAKSGSVDMMEVLVEFKANLNIQTQADSKMLPIHWAASDGKLAMIQYLLAQRCDINSLDGNGCTPAIVATQHEQATCVVYLVQHGADLSLADGNGDTALHWAAYKGFIELTGLCSYLSPQSMDREDIYGQKPIHLAALRGNDLVVEYLVVDCGADTSSKDKNGLNPLELATKKKQLKAEWTLRRLMSKDIVELIKGLGFDRLKDPRILTNIFLGSNDREISAWPWRIVAGSNFMGTMYSIYFAFNPALNDLTMLHTINTMVQCLWWFFFYMCLQPNTAAVYDEVCRDDDKLTQYESSLAKIGNSINEADMPNLCHTCRVRKPLRSKHCKFQRKCINKFDHFCPFVYNTVSRDNYKYFIGCISVHMLCSISWLVTAGYLMRREEVTWFFCFFIAFLVLWMGMVGGLTSYHTNLISKNLTTNEQSNAYRYKYLHNSYNIFDNPFDKGDQNKNIIDGLFPSTKMYYAREEVVKDRMRAEDGEDVESASPLINKEVTI
jgi:ankyrin repeat protein